MLNYLEQIISRLLEAFIFALFVALVAVVFSQVIARYVLETPFSWSEESARFILIWLSLSSAVYAFQKGSHFSLQMIMRLTNEKWGNLICLVSDLAVFFLFALIFYYSIDFVSGVSGHIAPAMQIPMEIPYSAILFASGGIALLSIKNFFSHLKLMIH